MNTDTKIYTTSTDREIALRRFVEGPSLLENTLADIDSADLDRPPTDGGWTIRQNVHHIADGDDIWKTAIKIALGSDKAVFSLAWYWLHTQVEWANCWAYSHRSVSESLALLKANRHHIAQLITEIPQGWTRSVSAQDSKGAVELITVGFIVEMQSDHLVHHVMRIQAIHKQGGGT